MNFDPKYFVQASLAEPHAHYSRCAGELASTFEREWEVPLQTPPPSLAQGVMVPFEWQVHPDIARSWGATPAEMVKLGLKTHQLVALASPEQHVWTNSLVTRHAAFQRAAEALLLDVARHIEPWGGVPPMSIQWVVSHAGPPTVIDLGVALSAASYTLEEALEEESAAIEFERRPEIPRIWSTVLGDAIRWEVAASRGLTISPSFGAPRAIVNRGFKELKNPFLPIINVWRSGVVMQTRFDSNPALLAVAAGRL